MIDQIREIALSLCITLIATAIFSMLVSGKSMEKILRFMLSAFFLNCLILPFLNGETGGTSFLKSEADTSYGEELEARSEESFKKLAEIRLGNEVESLLELQGVSPKKVEMEIHIDEEKNITITKCDIYLSEEETFSAGDLSYYVKKEVGVVPEFIIEKGTAE